MSADPREPTEATVDEGPDAGGRIVRLGASGARRGLAVHTRRGLGAGRLGGRELGGTASRPEDPLRRRAAAAALDPARAPRPRTSWSAGPPIDPEYAALCADDGDGT